MGLLVDVVSPAPRDLWSAAVAADLRSLADATPAWSDAACEGLWSDASRAYLLDDGSAVVLPLLRRPGPVGWAASMPTGWGYGGLVGARAHDPAVVRAVAADLQRMRLTSLRVRPLPEDADAWSATGALFVSRRAHVLHLTAGVEVLRAGLRKSVRRAVRRCADVDVRVGTSADLLDDYEVLWRRSVDRWAAAQSEPLWLARRRALWRDPPSRMRSLARQLPEALRVWVAYVAGEPVATNVVALGPCAHATRASLDVDRAPAGVAHYLDWLAIEDACTHGARSLNLGESGSSASLAFYKEGLGAVPVDYVEARFERLPITPADRLARTAVKRAIGFRDASG